MEVDQVVVRLVADTTQYFASLDYAGARLLGYSAGMVAGIAKHGIQMAATFEKNSVAVKTMVGDVEKGTKLINDLVQLAIDTPFSSDELVQTAKQLKSFGFETEAIIPTLQALGNVSAGTGTDINRITLAFGQVKVAGKLMGTELRQFVDAGVPLIAYLAKVMGKPVESIRTLTEQGMIGFQQVVEAFNAMNAAGGQFAGLMDVISKQTVSGRWQAFKETLDVMSRNFATAAMEGLGLRSALGGAADALQEMNKAGSGETVSFFADVRVAVNGIAMVLKQVGGFVQDVYRQVRTWLKANQAVAQTVVAIAATVWTLYLAIKTVTFAIVAMRMALMAVYALSGIMSLVSAFASLVALVATTVSSMLSLFAAIGPIVAVVGLIVGSLIYMDAFKFSGAAFSQGLEAMQGMGDVLGRIVKLLRSGDLEGAWELVTVSFLYAWRVMVLTMKAEFAAAMRGLGEAAPTWLRVILTGESPRTIEKGKAARADMDRQEMEAQATAAKHGLSLFSAYELNAWQDILNAERTNADTLTKQLAALKNDTTGFGAGPGGLISIAKWEQDIKNSISAQLKSNQFIADIMKRAGTEKSTAVGNSIMNDPIAKQRKAEIDRLMQKTATALPTSFGEVVGRAIMSAVGPGSPLSQMAVPYGISGQARDVMNALEKELVKGVGAWDHFTKQIALINEARWGSAKGHQMAAAMGGFAFVADKGAMGGPGSDAMLKLGYSMEFAELQKKLGDGDMKMPPALLQGTTAAQDTINANMANQLTVEQEVLSVLTASKLVQEQTKVRNDEIAETLKKIVNDPAKLKLFGFNGN